MLNENKGDDMIEILKRLHQYILQEEVEGEIYMPHRNIYSPSAQAVTWR